MAREGQQPHMIASHGRTSRDNTMPPGFILAAQHEHDERRQEQERTRQPQPELGHQRER